MITMQDVAEEAKVSRGTVSYVLSGKHKKAQISEITKDKILKIADNMGYRCNAIAQSMRTGKSKIIGITGRLCSSYCMEIIKGISVVVSRNNYMIKLLSVETVEDVKNVARQCIEQRLAGVICRSLSEEGFKILRSELEHHNIPIVLVDNFSQDWCSRVISDDFEGAKQATEYLLKLGHRKIGIGTSELNQGFSKVRYDGYVQMMAKWGIEVQKRDICFIGHEDEILDKQWNDIKDFLEQQRPTAIFCVSDPAAMKVIAVAHGIGMKVPERLSVIGYGNLEYTGFSSPPLTTVAQPFKKMGEKVAEVLFANIENKAEAEEFKILNRLMIRKSVAGVNNNAQAVNF